MTSDELGSDIGELGALAIGLVPGAGVAAPAVAAALSFFASMLIRRINGEPMSDIKAQPILESEGIDVEALRKSLEASV